MDGQKQIKLMKHQQEAVTLCGQYPRFALLWDCGLGKTIAMLAHHQNKPMPTLVVCPKAIMYAAWEMDCKLMGQPVTVMHGTPSQRSRIVSKVMSEFNLTDDDVTYEMTDNVGPVPLIVTNFETFRKKEVRQTLIQELSIRRLIVDESSKIKNPKSLVTKATIAFADKMDEVYLLSGTPAPNGPHEYWAQLRCLDKTPGGLADHPDSHVPPNFYRWAGHWLFPEERWMGKRKVVTGWRMKPMLEDDFQHALATRSQTLKMEDAFDLPPVSARAIRIQLGAGEAKHYANLVGMLQTELENGTVNTTATALLTKLRQVTGGHLYNDGEQLSIGTAKLDALAEIVESIGSKPVIIWAEYTAEINSIEKRMTDMGRKVWVMNGKTKNNGQRCAQFQTNTEIDTLVCHPQSVGHGVTLTKAAYSIFYSYGFSYEYHHQARARNYRKGQTQKVIHTYIIAEGTVDQDILLSLRAKKKDSNGVIDALRSITQGGGR